MIFFFPFRDLFLCFLTYDDKAKPMVVPVMAKVLNSYRTDAYGCLIRGEYFFLLFIIWDL